METVASVVGIADFASKLINGIGSLVVQYQNLPEVIAPFPQGAAVKMGTDPDIV